MRRHSIGGFATGLWHARCSWLFRAPPPLLTPRPRHEPRPLPQHTTEPPPWAVPPPLRLPAVLMLPAHGVPEDWLLGKFSRESLELVRGSTGEVAGLEVRGRPEGWGWGGRGVRQAGELGGGCGCVGGAVKVRREAPAS